MDWVATLAAHRQHLLTAYTTPNWAEVSAAYGAEGSDRTAQLKSALHAVVDWARSASDDPELLGHLDSYVDEAMKETAPQTGATAGLSMIFANAVANTGWWANKLNPSTTYIASCGGCGATQTRVLHFQCEYCDQPLYPERE